MPFAPELRRRTNPLGALPPRLIRVRSLVRALLWLAAVPGIASAISLGQVPQPPPRTPHPVILPDANRLPDANDQMEMREQQEEGKTKGYAAANLERKKQIADDAARLVKLAAELKAAVDKTSKNTLSLDVIRKAEEIERLARSVREKMRLSAGAS
ncbi:MAG TPA: hypothetical protein VLZ50_00945 [Terracidiphilus sp.]|nr:hypothetical protein [Terracidiphilus sp.]